MLLTMRGSRNVSAWKSVCLGVTIALALQLLPISSLALPPPQSDLQSAIELYDFAEFDQAIERLRGLIDSGSLADRELVSAYDYLGRAYVKRGLGGDRDLAKEAFQEMLRLDPNKILTDLEVPPDIVAVFDEAKADMEGATREPEPEPEPETPVEGTAPMKPTEEPKGGSPVLSYGLLGGTVVCGVLWIVGDGAVKSANDDIESAINDGSITSDLFDDADSKAGTRDLFAALTIGFAVATLGYYFFVKRPQGRGFFSAQNDIEEKDFQGKRVELDLNVKEKRPYVGLSVSF